MAMKTERSNCRFLVRKSDIDKPQILLKLFQTTTPLRESRIGYELLGGTTLEQANKIAALLNDYVLNLFVEPKSPANP